MAWERTQENSSAGEYLQPSGVNGRGRGLRIGGGDVNGGCSGE